MATDEEYLDNLLKSLTESDSQSADDEAFSMSSDDSGIDADMLADLLAEAMPAEDSGAGKNDSDLSADVFADLLAEDSGSLDEAASNESVLNDLLTGENDSVSDSSTLFDDMEDWQSDLDDLLAKADAQVEADTASAHSDNTDAANLIDNHGNEFDAISEDDMLALLEGGQIDNAENNDSSAENVSDLSAENMEDPASAKAKKKKEKAEKRKKKEKKRSKQKEGEETSDGKKPEEQQEADQSKEKTGFFSKVLTYLTQEEDELAGVSEENAEILQELSEEDKAKEKKKKKKKEKAKAASEDVEDGEEEADTKKKKKKEKKKKEKEKEKEDAVKEKPVKVLSRRNMLVLVAACATLIACVLIFSTFLPEYADKQSAHQAFYEGEYEEVYMLLYDKNLNSNDMLIYNKAQTILTIERKLKSYEGNIAINRELEALDALMQGVNCYQNLAGTDMYGMEMEVESIYQQICGILQNNYGITPDEAIEINAYDNELYTRKLISVIDGTEFSLPGEEPPIEELPPQDILPEEEEIISY